MTQTRTGFDVPDLRRLRYFHGQMLGARDFQREQEYFRNKLKLRLRYLLGYGVVCGLLVEPAGGDDDHGGQHDQAAPADAAAPGGADATPPAGEGGAESGEAGGAEPGEPGGTGPADAADDGAGPQSRQAKVRITPGLGVDAYGNEIVVRTGCEVDLWAALDGGGQAGASTDRRTLWIGVEYCEDAVEPTRTIFTSECGDTSDCEFGWTRETVKVRVTATRPDPDLRCDTCGDPHGDTDGHGSGSAVLWLARIDDVDPQHPVRPDQIDNAIRRPFGQRVPTVITGINWIHGHTYTVAEARALLGTTDQRAGLVVHFSDDVRVDGLRPGVVDIQVIEGGAGREAGSWFMGGEFAGLPDAEFTREFRYRQTTRETLQDGDRALITVRTAFLLDRCCRPVDGTHVGGRVPVLGRRRDAADPQEQTHRGCAVPPSGIGPWTSGVGLGGDVFESWFFVKEG